MADGEVTARNIAFMKRVNSALSPGAFGNRRSTVIVTMKATAIFCTIDMVRRCIVTSQLAGTAYRRGWEYCETCVHSDPLVRESRYDGWQGWLRTLGLKDEGIA